MCDENGDIITDGGSTFTIRQDGVDSLGYLGKCSGQQVCCREPTFKDNKPAGPCSDYENEGFKCVSQDLCDENGEIITDGGSKFTIRQDLFNSPANNAICPQFDVCCKDPNFEEEEDTSLLDTLFDESPETESRPCSDYENKGFKCVSQDLCDENGEIIADGGSKFTIRQDLFTSPANNAICPQFDVCCKDPNFEEEEDTSLLDTLFDESPETESRPCSDYENKGFKCVSQDLCDENGEIIADGGSKFTIRQDLFTSPANNAICPQFDVCCKDPNFAALSAGPCSDYENEGFKCVSQDLCDQNGDIITDGGSTFTIRQDGVDSLGYLGKCSRQQVCCRDPTYKEKILDSSRDTTRDKFASSQECNDYEDQGYSCVQEDQCDNGQIITDGGSSFSVRQDNLGLNLKCPRGRGTCCRHPDFTQALAPVIVRPCRDFANQGYACVPKGQCSAATTYSTRGSVNINVNIVAKCSSQLETCCGPTSSDPPVTPVSPPQQQQPSTPFR